LGLLERSESTGMCQGLGSPAGQNENDLHKGEGRGPISQLLTTSLIVPPLHHSIGTPFRGPVVAPLLVGRLGHDRRDLRRAAVFIQRDVAPVARIRVSYISGQPVL